jgi:tetratricopeptide (TPR) repeat protein
MIQSCSYAWIYLWAVMVCTSAITEAEELPEVSSRDYFSIVSTTSESYSRRSFRNIEQHHLSKALINLRQGKAREAINDCVYVLDRAVNHPKGLAILGFAARLAKEPSLPVRYYERAVTLYPGHAMTHAQYGKYLAEIGKREEGVKRLQRAIEIDPGFKVAYTWLAHLYVQLGQVDLARQMIQRRKEATDRPPRESEVLSEPDKENFYSGDKSIDGIGEEKSIDNPPFWTGAVDEEQPFEGQMKEKNPYPFEER